MIALLYSGVGTFHYVFRKQFFMISENREQAIAEGHNVVLWDFLFYASFGVVVTSSVHIAGVLLVFSLLVIPPVSALLVVQSRALRLVVGWILAFAATLVGLFASVELDKPTGPTIIVSLIGIMLLVALYSRFMSRRTT